MANVAGVTRDVLPLFDAGAIRVVVDGRPAARVPRRPIHGVRPELLRLKVVRERRVESVKLSRMLCRA